jgi:fimbrial chaperone protein
MINLPRLIFAFIVAAAVQPFAVPSVLAMAVEPLLLDLTSSGRTAQQSVKVINNEARPLPVELSVSRLELGLDGEQKTASSADEFLIYPPQAMIPKGGSQVFRIQWIGEPDIPKSRSYQLMVSQLPVKMAKDQNGIQIVMSFGVTVNVAPPAGKSDLVVTGASPVTDKDGKRRASLTVKNPGNKHAYLRQSLIELSGAGWSAQMTPALFAQKVGFGIVQPGKERRFLLPIEVPGNVGAIKAKVKYQPEER